MKRATLILFVLVTLLSGAEAIEVMNRNEYVRVKLIRIANIVNGKNPAPKIYEQIVYPVKGRSLGVEVVVPRGKKQRKIFLHLVFVYILLSPAEFGFIILAVTLVIMSAYIIFKVKQKETKVNE